MPLGRPKGTIRGRKVALALAEVTEVVSGSAKLQLILSQMTDRQRRLFIPLAQGRNELEAVVEAGLFEYLTGITKKLGTRDGRKMMTTSIRKVANLDRLSPESYSRLLSIAQSAVRSNVGDFDFVTLHQAIQGFFHLIAPQAVDVVAEIMLNERVSHTTRLRAAQDILDRAGYKKEIKDSPEVGLHTNT